MSRTGLLPDNQSRLETALAKTNEEFIGSADADVIRRVKRPKDCPSHLLPWLAWELRLTLDTSSWPEQKLRDVLDRIWILKRSIGLDKGYVEHAALAGGKVLKVTRPPQMLVAMPAPTEEQQRAYYAQFRQLRLHTHSKTIFRGGRTAVMSQAVANGRAAFAGRMAAVSFTATEVIERTATIYDPRDGSEVEVERVDSALIGGGVEQIYVLKRKVPGAMAAGGRGMAVVAPPKETETFALQDSGTVHDPATGPRHQSIAPSITPVSIVPERTVHPQKVSKAALAAGGSGLAAISYRRAERFTDMVRLFEPDRVPKGTRQRAVGGGRLGMEEHTVELLIDVKMPKRRLRNCGFAAGGAVVAYDPEPMRLIREAVDAATPGGTEAFIDTQTKRRLRWSDAPKVGQFKIGDAITTV